MRPVARQMMVLVFATVIALAVLLAYFFWPVGAGGLAIEWYAVTDVRAASRLSVPSVQFVDVTANAHIDFMHYAGESLHDIRQVMSPGLGLADLNGDGAIDLMLLNSAAPGGQRRAKNAVYLNRGGMRFEALPDAGGADSGEWAMGCAIADYDADGDLDVYVTALGPNRLYRNEGDARFRDVAASLGVDDDRWSTGCAFADYDLDGDLDLYVANYLRFDASRIPGDGVARYDRNEPPAFSPYVFPAASDALLRNDSDKFTNVTESAGVMQESGKGMGVLFADLSNDGLPDLLVVNDVSHNAFFQNHGGGTFRDAGAVSGLDDPRSGMGIAMGDFDNDGAFDVFSTHWQDESNVLYRNLCQASGPCHTPFFEDVTIQAGLAAPSMGHTGWGAAWADFDLDADLDLLVVNGYTSPAPTDATQCIGQRVLLFLNDKGRFVEQSPAVGFASMSQYAARGAGTADLDDDGDLDVVISVNNGPVRVFENRLEGGRWLKVRPVGGVVIGIVVRVHCGDLVQQRMIVSGSSYLCSEPAEAHFGLGDHAMADRVDVCWPDGTKQVLADVPPNQTLVVPKP